MSDPMGIALIGAGGAAPAWARVYGETEEARVVAVFDESIDKARRLAATIPDAEAFADLGQLLAQGEIWAAEINLPSDLAMAAATQCLEAGVGVGLRGATIRSRQAVASLEGAMQSRSAVRLFSPSFYYPPVERARQLLAQTALGDAQTMRVRSVLGRYGRSADSLLGEVDVEADRLNSPEFEALSLIFLLGDVQSVHAWERDGCVLVTWNAGTGVGAGRYGVYEAIRAPQVPVRSRLEPLDETFEIAGTDGYIFGGGITGCVRESPALATYILDKYEQPVAQLDDNPLAAYRKGADDLITALRRRATPRFGIEWAHEIALVKDAIRRSLELGEEISLDGLS